MAKALFAASARASLPLARIAALAGGGVDVWYLAAGGEPGRIECLNTGQTVFVAPQSPEAWSAAAPDA